MKTRRILGAAAAAVLAITGLTACGSATENPASTRSAQPDSWDAVVEAAEKEGTITVYASLTTQMLGNMEAALKKAYPSITFQVIGLAAPELDPKLNADRTTGADGGDVVMGANSPTILALSEEGELLAPIGPNSSSAEFAGSDRSLGGEAIAVAFTGFGIGVNTDKFTGEITSWDDLIDPGLSGSKLGALTPGSPTIWDYYNTISDSTEDGQDAFLEALIDQDPVYYQSAIPLTQALAAGEISVGMFTSYLDITALEASGAPVEFVLPESGTWTAPIFTYAPAWSKHPNGAQVVMDFLASPAGQAALGKGAYSPLADTPDVLAPLSSVHVSNPAETLSEDFVAKWKPFYTDLFKLAG